MGSIVLASTVMPTLLPMKRTPGLHVSQVIHYLASHVLGHYKSSNASPSNTARLELGNAVERALITALDETFPDEYIRPGELYVDGIYLTPDLFHLPSWTVDEFKNSKITSRHDPTVEHCPACQGVAPTGCTKMWKWWVQIASYCRAMNSTRGRLRVLFNRGDYTDGQEQYGEWIREFDREELSTNWSMVLSAAAEIRCPECQGVGGFSFTAPVDGEPISLDPDAPPCAACDGKGVKPYALQRTG